MLLFRLAFRNLLRHPVKTTLIATFIALGTALVFLANSIFESTTEGLERSLVGSLTGHFAVAPLTEEIYGIFGSEVPIIDEYERTPPISDFAAVAAALDGEDRVAAWTPLVSMPVQVGIGRYRPTSVAFGVDFTSYFKVCEDLEILRGDIGALGAGGVFLNERWVALAEKALRRPLRDGEKITFSVASNNSFRLRTGFFAGVYRYPAPSEALDRVVLADPVLVRAMSGFVLGYGQPRAEAENTAFAADDLDALFMGAEDIVAPEAEGLSLAGVEADLADTADRDAFVITDNGAWSFALAKVQPGAAVEGTRRTIMRRLAGTVPDVRVLNWPTAAGNNALMLFVLRTTFNIGVAFLVFGAMLVVMNTLVISVLERTAEVGSMRALGASRDFIRSLFILETMILTLSSATIGIVIGTTVALIGRGIGIPISNPILIGLFGGSTLKPSVNGILIFGHLVAAGLVGSLAWLYPVALALRIPPVAAMASHE